MTNTSFKTLLIGVALAAGTYISSCKSKTADTTSTGDTTAVAPSSIDTSTVAPPVSVAPYDTLAAGVRDATKDFPGVKADVENGEVTLSGNIKRDQLQRLMMAVHSLRPKKVNNKLTITK